MLGSTLGSKSPLLLIQWGLQSPMTVEIAVEPPP
jgi:hypothetical protein